MAAIMLTLYAQHFQCFISLNKGYNHQLKKTTLTLLQLTIFQLVQQHRHALYKRDDGPCLLLKEDT